MDVSVRPVAFVGTSGLVGGEDRLVGRSPSGVVANLEGRHCVGTLQ